MGAKKPQPAPAAYKGPTVQRPSVLPPAPPRACRKHAASPVVGYSRCVGCEVEHLRRENESLKQWIRDEGENNNTCTYGVLREVCEYCQCGRK